MQKITPHLWFDKEAKEAAEFYTSVFPKSKIKDITTLDNTPSGTVDVVTIELLGQEFMLLSAGPLFKFNEAISFIVYCDTQEEIDHYWEKLRSAGSRTVRLAQGQVRTFMADCSHRYGRDDEGQR
jgi:predicted 3-demethylubiquinone-9 3-methyltransferase (glyoxalase superfamily)